MGWMMWKGRKLGPDVVLYFRFAGQEDATDSRAGADAQHKREREREREREAL